jgi:hypothetical protein
MLMYRDVNLNAVSLKANNCTYILCYFILLTNIVELTYSLYWMEVISNDFLRINLFCSKNEKTNLYTFL